MGKDESIHVLAGQSAQILDELNYHRRQGIERSKRLDELFNRGGNVEMRIKSLMVAEPTCAINVPLVVNEKEISSEVADYCFRHYSSLGLRHVNGVVSYCPFALEMAPFVSSFVAKIKGLRGQRILTASGESPLEEGIIDGECQFVRENGFRYLFVPVGIKRSFVPPVQADLRLFVNPDFFSYDSQGSLCFNTYPDVFLATNYIEARIPGGIPNNLYLYAGNRLVEQKKQDFRGIGVDLKEE
jgi:hypothetical protein